MTNVKPTNTYRSPEEIIKDGQKEKYSNLATDENT